MLPRACSVNAVIPIPGKGLDAKKAVPKRNRLELDQAHENHQPAVEHRRCKILPPLRKRFAKGPE